MIWAAYLGLPLSLEMVGTVLGLDKQKLKEGRDLVRYFASPCKPTKANGQRTRNLPADAPERWERYKEYNRWDVETEVEIYRRLLKYPMPEQEWAYYWLDQRINDRGIALDMTLVDNAIRFDEINQQHIDQELRTLTGLANPNSNTQLLGWLRGRGFDIDSVAKEPLKELRKSGIDAQTGRVLVLHGEAAKTSVKKYYAMRNCVCADGRAHGQIQFYGANRTGRFAGRLIQIQNLAKNKMKDLGAARGVVRSGDYDCFAMIYDASQVVLSELIRTACVPKPGCKFIVAEDIHNGPRCAVCGFYFCGHCGDGRMIDDDSCPGPDAMPRIHAERYARNIAYELRDNGRHDCLAFQDPAALREDELRALLPLFPAVAVYVDWLEAVRQRAVAALGAEVVGSLVVPWEPSCMIKTTSEKHFPYAQCCRCGYREPIEWPLGHTYCPGCGAKVSKRRFEA